MTVQCYPESIQGYLIKRSKDKNIFKKWYPRFYVIDAKSLTLTILKKQGGA